MARMTRNEHSPAVSGSGERRYGWLSWLTLAVGAVMCGVALLLS